jgi:hypothetical protein
MPYFWAIVDVVVILGVVVMVAVATDWINRKSGFENGKLD